NVGFRTWAKKQALDRDLHGNVENLKDGRVRIRVMGTDQEQLESFEASCHSGPRRAKVEEVEVNEWDKPLQIGFETIGNTNGHASSKEIKKLAAERERIKREKASALEKFGLLQSPRTWRYMESLKRIAKK